MCNGNGNDPTTITITITATAANPYPPTISDGTTTVSTEPADTALVTGVTAGDIVKFVKGGNISSIEIVEKPGSENVFSTDPTKANKWIGVVGTLPPGSEESYTINYKIGGTDYSLDPRIQVRAKTS